ncbi:MAG TPA: dTDP-4-dehydrorhamnose reductase [Castellaniella sp.]|nr:dTDP-4-dehydrorhamnose reductase [Castellaniella sp.]
MSLNQEAQDHPAALRVLVTGAQGQLGRALQACIARLPTGSIVAQTLDRRTLDITCDDSVAACLDRFPADVLINAAAYTAVDRAAQEPQQAMAVNAKAPERLARACAQRDIRLLHVSTDYVFDGQSSRPYIETDHVHPLNTYGASKLEGERAVLAHAPDSLILRTSWVFSAHGYNFVKTILRLARERSTLQVIDDQIGGPTWAGHIAEVLLALSMRARACTPAGLYHFSGNPTISWYGFAQEIIDQALHLGLIQRRPEVRAIAGRDWPAAEPRPDNSGLDNSKLAALMEPLPRDWRSGLQTTLQTLAQTPEALQ